MEKYKKLLEKSVIILFLVNVYPIFGVLFFGWDYFVIVLLYIIETVIIGLINILKMAKADGRLSEEDKKKMNFKDADRVQAKSLEENPGCMKFFLIPFFLVHYNMFVVVQTIFVVVISSQFGNREISIEQFLNLDFIFSLVFLFGSHLYSYIENYIKRGEYKQSSTIGLMFQPYKRIVIQQITVIGGTFIIMSTQAPVFFLVVLIALKIIFDLRAHFKIHRGFL